MTRATKPTAARPRRGRKPKYPAKDWLGYFAIPPEHVDELIALRKRLRRKRRSSERYALENEIYTRAREVAAREALVQETTKRRMYKLIEAHESWIGTLQFIIGRNYRGWCVLSVNETAGMCRAYRNWEVAEGGTEGVIDDKCELMVFTPREFFTRLAEPLTGTLRFAGDNGLGFAWAQWHGDLEASFATDRGSAERDQRYDAENAARDAADRAARGMPPDAPIRPPQDDRRRVAWFAIPAEHEPEVAAMLDDLRGAIHCHYPPLDVWARENAVYRRAEKLAGAREVLPGHAMTTAMYTWDLDSSLPTVGNRWRDHIAADSVAERLRVFDKNERVFGGPDDLAIEVATHNNAWDERLFPAFCAMYRAEKRILRAAADHGWIAMWATFRDDADAEAAALLALPTWDYPAAAAWYASHASDDLQQYAWGRWLYVLEQIYPASLPPSHFEP